MRQKILNWLVTPIFIFFFCGILLVFHPLQLIAHQLGYSAHKLVYDVMNFLLILNFRLAGARIRVNFRKPIPEGKPLLIVSNHQSMFDIPLLVWYLRKHHPKFVSKIELGRGIPSISFALRHLGSALIDRGDPAQAIPAIRDFGQEMNRKKFSICMFPEGTRARTGAMRHFKPMGLMALVETMPDALIVPVAIQGSWKLVKNNLLPVTFGVNLSLEVIDVISQQDLKDKDPVKFLEDIVRTTLESGKA